MPEFEIDGDPSTAFDAAPQDECEQLQLSYEAYSASCDVGDRLAELIARSDALSELDEAARALRDARDRIDLRLREIADRQAELRYGPQPVQAALPLVAA